MGLRAGGPWWMGMRNSVILGGSWTPAMQSALAADKGCQVSTVAREHVLECFPGDDSGPA